MSGLYRLLPALALATTFALAARFLYQRYSIHATKVGEEQEDEEEEMSTIDGVKICSPGAWPPRFATEPERLVTIATWNTLRRHYAFRGHSWVPSRHRDWKHRQDALHKEMSKFSADFLCLQEAELRDLDKDFVEPLSTSGYKHVTADPKGGHDHTKPVIFYNSSRFELLWCKPKSRAVVAHFKEITSDNSLIIASCHLQGGQQAPTRYTQGRSILKAIDHRMRSLDPGSPRARSASSSRSPGRKRGKRDSSSRDDSSSNNEESSQAIGHVSRPKESETTPPRPACIICGDFNAYRDDPSIRLFKAGRFSKKDWIIDDGEPPRRIDFSAPMVGGLADAYSVMDLKGEEGTRPYTFQWGAMMTENKVHRMIIDYILHTPPPPPPSPSSPPLDSKGASSSATSFKAKRPRQQDALHNRSGLKLRALRTPLGPRRRKEMARNGVGIPNAWHPSDHFPLAAVFEFAAPKQRRLH